MKKKALIIASTGMLGSAVSKELVSRNDVYLTFRNVNAMNKLNDILQLSPLQYHRFDPNVDTLENLLYRHEHIDLLINCLGTIKPFSHKNIADTIFTNSVFPHRLADFCEKNNIPCVHITSDCCYVGAAGPYSELSKKDADDLYGITKALGEPENCMTIRTSIIGEEIHKYASLISWAKSMSGTTVHGFTNHYWNGITTKEFGKICQKILDNPELYEPGIYHVFSNVVTKYEMLQEFNKKWDLRLNIVSTESPTRIDRTLCTVKDLNGKLNIPSFKRMMEEI